MILPFHQVFNIGYFGFSAFLSVNLFDNLSKITSDYPLALVGQYEVVEQAGQAFAGASQREAEIDRYLLVVDYAKGIKADRIIKIDLNAFSS
jgi:hypothetical protein